MNTKYKNSCKTARLSTKSLCNIYNTFLKVDCRYLNLICDQKIILYLCVFYYLYGTNIYHAFYRIDPQAGMIGHQYILSGTINDEMDAGQRKLYF